MKYHALLTATLAGLICLPAVAQDAAPIERNASLKMEIERAVAKGLAFLQTKQNADGSWSDAEMPALTALPVRAFAGDPNRKEGAPLPDSVKKAVDWLLKTQKEDGGFYNRGLGSYNTAIVMMALLAANDPANHDALLKARSYLVKQQHDFDIPGEKDNPLDGGLGYGSRPIPDMSNTVIAMEALAKTKKLFEDRGDQQAADLDWEAALTFISRSQNLPGSNDQAWAQTPTAEDHGGFIYSPTESKAGEVALPGGGKGQRSYGSMSYAGLLSMIYADVKADDPRVTAVRDWISRHYTLKENPNMGAQGLFYYYHTMAKALAAANVNRIEKKDAEPVDWRTDLAVRLFDLQNSDGSWVNEESKRWMEDDGVLVTSYALLALEQIYHSL
jgi:squalene-hopene/tetraprenyl-beta-curcumene cyclase